MKRLKTPVVLDHGLTADVDWEGDEPCVHIRGSSGLNQPVMLRLTKGQLDQLQLVVEKAAAISAAAAAKEPA